ncbi:DUF6445 family protein [Sphingomonas sp. SM33]|uniref:DUF6445 family protein n=1 Tax=Sphingomonas telluris TaxID=2907998 RepID=A0ABS9VMC9_9SPHN|nr:DUF6445 family protein [Sphingomonas telluris]
MRPELRRVGVLQSPVVVIDDFTGDAEAVARLADALAPYPFIRDSYYPGVRQLIRRGDREADAYVERLCNDAAQFIAGAFEYDSFDLAEASFSIVTTDPPRLSEPQRMPHFDSTDPKYLALLHYLRVPEGTGTAFYRQRSTNIEMVTDDNRADFIRAAQSEVKQMPLNSGYIRSSNDFFEQIGAVEAVPDRLVIYQGSLLHSGIIPPGMNFSTDPRVGRLTANIFVRGH